MLIEDVCESHGATFNNKKLGTYGEISNFSFYYAHHMSTVEGGMVSTNNREIYEKVRIMRSHGMLRESLDQKLKSNFYKKYPKISLSCMTWHIRSICKLINNPDFFHNKLLLGSKTNFKLFES